MKKQIPYGLEGLIESLIERFRIPTKEDIDSLIKKTERSLQGLRLPTRAEFNRLVKRVDSLEKALGVRKKPAGKTAGRRRTAKKTAVKKRRVSRAKPQMKMTDSEMVLGILRRYKTGADVGKLKARTGFEDKKIRNIIFKLTKTGKIERVDRGVYKAKA
jgi:hypothetical protein